MLGISFITLVKKELIREWSSKHFSLLPELGMIVVFGIIIKTAPIPSDLIIQNFDFMTFIGLGLVTTSVITNSFASTAFGLVHAKMENYIVDFIMPPLGKEVVYLALIMTATISALLSSICIGGVLFLFGMKLPGILPMLEVIAICSILAFSFALLGIVAACYSQDWDSISAKFSLMLLPLIYCSGVFYELQSIDPNFQWILLYNPVYYLFCLIREIASGQTISGIGLFSLAGLVGISLLVSFVFLRKRIF
ncbi:MAG: ABC transporter permease [Methylacidiphilales bacterium]|nr:ABC transporter permease [Candidatus Methylacidiphilales bacterium]